MVYGSHDVGHELGLVLMLARVLHEHRLLCHEILEVVHDERRQLVVRIELQRLGEPLASKVMSEEFVRRRLFKPFDTTKGTAGMGIGAYQAREVVRGLGGDITVASELGKGTTVRLVLPLLQPASAQISSLSG